MTDVLKKLIITILLLFSVNAAFAQFGDILGKGMGMGDNKSSDTTSGPPSYTLGRYFKSLGHKDTMSISWAFGGSLLLPGSAQIYNKDYWKLPIIYCGIGGMIGGSIYFNNKFKKSGNEEDNLYGNLFLAGAALFYWGQMMDGAANYRNYRSHLPGRATVYSILMPGLGQIYNKEYWKLPIYYGGMAAAGYFWYYNDLQFKRFKSLYNQATAPNSDYSGQNSPDNLKHFRDYHRRFRDYSALATVVIYLLQIIDADVFATMNEFDVNQEISMTIEPAVITPIDHNFSNNYAYSNPTGTNAIGIKMNFKF